MLLDLWNEKWAVGSLVTTLLVVDGNTDGFRDGLAVVEMLLGKLVAELVGDGYAVGQRLTVNDGCQVGSNEVGS